VDLQASDGIWKDGAMGQSDAVKAYQFRVFSALQGVMTAAMIHLGDRLGLYEHLAGSGPITVAGLAERAGLHERWVLEWARQQGAAGIVELRGDVVELPAEGVAVLADPTHDAYGAGSFHELPDILGALGWLPEAFRTGIGRHFDGQGEATTVGMERSFEPWHRRHLVADVFPQLDGVVADLEAGAAGADVGCGAGGAVLLLAEAFPASTFTGYDISQLALARAEQRRAEAGVANARFADASREPLPADGSLRLVTSIECIHDMTDPAAMAGAIRASLADDGTWLLVDMKALDTFDDNVARNPMAALMYGFSIVSCLSSGLSEPGGAGLGTLGLPESKARELAAGAGFTRFRRLAVDHSLCAFYELRP